MTEFRIIESYVHDAAIGVLVELIASNATNAASPEFSNFAKGLAKHIAAMEPASVEELMLQPSVMNPDKAVGDLLAELVENSQGTLAIRRFVRWATSQ